MQIEADLMAGREVRRLVRGPEDLAASPALAAHPQPDHQGALGRRGNGGAKQVGIVGGDLDFEQSIGGCDRAGVGCGPARRSLLEGPA